MRTSVRQRNGEGRVLVVLLVALVAAAAVAYFITRSRSSTPIAVATPPPTPAPATPLPATPVAVATPTPQPIAAATPVATPTPPPLDLAMLARTPAIWPQQVALVRPVTFPVMIGGRMAGSAEAKPGTIVGLLRVDAAQLEVSYQGGRHMVPATSTDVLQRALPAFRNGVAAKPATPPPATPAPAVATATAPAPAMAAATPAVTLPPAMSKAKIGERLVAEVVRQKRSKIEGGDFDDKKEHITMKVKVTNTDSSMEARELKGEIFVLAESITERSAMKVLTSQQFDFSLSPRATHEMTTDEVDTAFDTTGLRFGFRYEGWLLRVMDKEGSVLLQKGSNPTFAKNGEQISKLSSGKTYDRSTFKEKEVMR